MLTRIVRDGAAPTQIAEFKMNQEHIEISTKQGKLRGLVKKSSGLCNTIYYSFQGIPYGKPPIGKLRFKTSEPFGKWEGVRDALKEGNDSIQHHMLFNHPVGDEDCLYLNVYTTQPEEGAKKAVMVWIHGGGFAGGSGSSELYGPDYLVEEDVVLVSVNYRCGVLGFLSFENEKLPGNLGLKDQVLALHWVHDNIDSFGGDPDNVTIFGESAGAASVNYHLLSPLSRGLFHKAILQSGCSLSQWAFQDNPREKALLLARDLGCTSEDPDTVLEFLMGVPAMDLVTSQDSDKLRTEKEMVQRVSVIFTPCVEKYGNAPFLTDCPRKLMERGEFAKVPVIIGLTDKEGMLVLAIKQPHFDLVSNDLSLLVPQNLATTLEKEEELRLGKEILKFYTNTDSVSWDVAPQYVDLIGDIHFTIPLQETRQYFLKQQTPVYSYLFTYTSPRALSYSTLPVAFPDRAEQFVGSGAGHGDELFYLFHTNITQSPVVPPSDDDQIFMSKFLKAWATFAKTSNPNCDRLGVSWKPDNIDDSSYLALGKIIKPLNGISFPDRTEFWKRIYEKCSYTY
ncbi:hypothetical protein J6590_043886 [Homalodisca vitripennis]|nr:hypothetical protein J6590_043886 [Homalodisca vitripennis]